MLPTLTVAENVYISSFPTRAGLIDSRVMAVNEKALRRLGCKFTPDARTPVPQHWRMSDGRDRASLAE